MSDTDNLIAELRDVVDDSEWSRCRDALEKILPELEEWRRLKEYAKSLGQETYVELHASNVQLAQRVAELNDSNSGAADEIERLTAENEERLRRNRLIQEQNDRLTAELAEARADLQTLWDASEDGANRLDILRGNAECERDRLLEDLETQRKIDLQIIAERDRLRRDLKDLKEGDERIFDRLRAAIEKHRERMRDEEQHPADIDLWDALAGGAEK